MYSKSIMGFDLETTGVKVYEDDTRVVSCAMILQESATSEMKIIETLMNPEIEIPEGASAVHGISTEKAREEGVNYLEGLQYHANLLKYTIENGIPTCAYNGAFDATLLRQEFIARGVDFDPALWDNLIMFDPLVMDKALAPFRKGKRNLTVVSGLYGYDLESAHEATADVLATMHVTRLILPKFADLIFRKTGEYPQTNQDIMELQALYYKDQAIGLESYFRKKENDPTLTINKSWPFQDRED